MGPATVLYDEAPGVTDCAYAAVARRRSTFGRLLGLHACAVDPSTGDATRAPTRVTGA